MSTTATILLDQTNVAILAILAGAQSARVGERSYSRADLGALRALRAELKAEAGIEAAAVAGTPYQARTYLQNVGR